MSQVNEFLSTYEIQTTVGEPLFIENVESTDLIDGIWWFKAGDTRYIIPRTSVIWMSATEED